MTSEINFQRRRFFGIAAMTVAAVEIGAAGLAHAKGEAPSPQPSTGRDGATSFSALKQVEAGVLSVGYAEAGPADGPVVLLLHG